MLFGFDDSLDFGSELLLKETCRRNKPKVSTECRKANDRESHDFVREKAWIFPVVFEIYPRVRLWNIRRYEVRQDSREFVSVSLVELRAAAQMNLNFKRNSALAFV